MTDMAAPSMIAQIIREHDGVVVRRIVRAILYFISHTSTALARGRGTGPRFTRN
jgi:hypothetical protein